MQIIFSQLFLSYKIIFKKSFSSFQKWETPVIYIVEGHEKPAVLPDITPYVSQLAIRNDSME